jgi:hypothetical protein
VLPEVKLNVAGESGPRTTPAGVLEYWRYGSRASGWPGGEPLTPSGVRDIAGICNRSERFAVMKSDTVGERVPAEAMIKRALGVETDKYMFCRSGGYAGSDSVSSIR